MTCKRGGVGRIYIYIHLHLLEQAQTCLGLIHLTLIIIVAWGRGAEGMGTEPGK